MIYYYNEKDTLYGRCYRFIEEHCSIPLDGDLVYLEKDRVTDIIALPVVKTRVYTLPKGVHVFAFNKRIHTYIVLSEEVSGRITVECNSACISSLRFLNEKIIRNHYGTRFRPDEEFELKVKLETNKRVRLMEFIIETR